MGNKAENAPENPRQVHRPEVRKSTWELKGGKVSGRPATWFGTGDVELRDDSTEKRIPRWTPKKKNVEKKKVLRDKQECTTAIRKFTAHVGVGQRRLTPTPPTTTQRVQSSRADSC